MNGCPPQPGLTVMQSARSTATSPKIVTGVAGQTERPGAAATVPDRIQRVQHVRRGLGVDRDAGRARLDEVGDLALGSLDHEVDVQVDRVADVSAQRGHDDRADRDRRHEVPVHDVDVDDGRARRDDLVDLSAQTGEISRQDRRRDDGCGQRDSRIGSVRFIRLPSASRRRSGCSSPWPSRTSGRSSHALHSQGRPSAARSDAGRRRSGTARAGDEGRNHGSLHDGQASPRLNDVSSTPAESRHRRRRIRCPGRARP